MKVFVTGATGFIGTFLTKRLLERGWQVRGMGRRDKPALPPGGVVSWEETWGHPNFEYFQGDLLDRNALERGIAGCEAVFHLAAYAKGWSRDRSIFTQFNVGGTRLILSIAEAAGVRRLVNTSSLVTFGTTKKGEVANESRPRPSERCFTDYEATKRIAEREAMAWPTTDGHRLEVVTVNPGRVFGPGLLTESNSVIVLMDLYRRGRFPFLINFGKNVGNYVLVDDVAEGMILAMEHGRSGERYLLGSDENLSLRDIYNFVDEFRGKKGFQFPIWLFFPLLVSYGMQTWANLTGQPPLITPGWVRTFSSDIALSCAKAKTELGYVPTPMHEAFEKTYRWMMEIQDSVPTK